MKRNSYLYKEYVFSLDTSDRVKTNKQTKNKNLVPMEVTFYLKEKANIWWYQVYSDNLKRCTDIKKCWCDICDEGASFYIGKIKKSPSKKAIYSWVLTYKKGWAHIDLEEFVSGRRENKLLICELNFLSSREKKLQLYLYNLLPIIFLASLALPLDFWFIFLISPIMFVYLFLISRSGKQYEWSWLNMSGVLKKKSRGKRLVGKMDVNN